LRQHRGTALRRASARTRLHIFGISLDAAVSLILADISVCVAHFRKSNPLLESLVVTDQVEWEMSAFTHLDRVTPAYGPQGNTASQCPGMGNPKFAAGLYPCVQ
jgi:hypothetical protein